MVGMNGYINLLLCIVMLAALVFETVLIVRRNRQILKIGFDDFFLVMLIMLAALFLLPFNEAGTGLEALRNTLALLVLFTTFAIKRGVYEKGVAKVFFTVPWHKVDRIQVDIWQNNKTAVYFYIGRFRFKLVYRSFQTAAALDYMTSHCSNIVIDQAVEKQISAYKYK